MAKKNKNEFALEAYVKCLTVTIPAADGGEVEVVRVPANEVENKLANQLLASRMRGVIDLAVSRYHQDKDKLSPKEIKELAEAASKIAEFSGMVYKDANAEPSGQNTSEVNVTPTKVDFSKMDQPATETAK